MTDEQLETLRKMHIMERIRKYLPLLKSKKINLEQYKKILSIK